MSNKYEDLIKNARVNAECGEHLSPAEVTTLLRVVETTLSALAAENAGLISSSECLLHEASEVYRAYNKTQLPDGDLVDEECLKGVYDAINATISTDAFLAEVRASAIDSLVDIKTKQLADMHPDTHAFGATAMSIRSQINELQVFAAQLRKGVQS